MQCTLRKMLLGQLKGKGMIRGLRLKIALLLIPCNFGSDHLCVVAVVQFLSLTVKLQVQFLGGHS